MKKSVFACVALFCWTVAAVDDLVTEAPPAHAKLHCIRFGSDVLCQVKCNKGYVPDPERPHASSYMRREGKWTTYPQRMQFPWADCVLASQ